MFKFRYAVRFSVFLVLLSFFSFLLPALSEAQTATDPLTELLGSLPAEAGSNSPNPPAANSPASSLETVTVVLVPGNEAQLEKLAREIKDPSSPRYGQTLAQSEFNQLYAPLQASVDNLAQYFLKQSLTISYQSLDRLVMVLKGTRTQLDSAFNTRSEYRNNKKGEQGWINILPLKLPVSLAGKIKGVTGFDTLHRFQTHNSTSLAVPLAPSTGPNTPASLRAAYNIGATAQNGSGSKIAITLWGAPSQPDLARWANSTDGQALTLPTPLNLTLIGPNTSPATDDKLRFEANMDVQLALTAAPQADVRFYVGASPLVSDMLTTISQAINDNVNVITGSWGVCEAAINSTTASSYHTVFTSATVKGIPLLFSSGDNGVFECQATNGGIGYTSFPAADDLVTAVGGTTLTRDDTTSAWVAETAWSCSVTDGSNDASCLKTNSGGGASGGGLATNYPRPTYQQNITPPAQPKFTYQPAGLQRFTPDISLNANPATGLLVYFNGTVNGLTCADDCRSGGSSASTPLLAGMVALAAQKKGNRQVGSLNPFLYANYNGAAWLNDVTTGYNGVAAQAGWDYTSGLGSLKDLNAFLTAFVPPTTPTNLVATAAPTNAMINLSWTNTATNQNGLKLERKTATGIYSQIAILNSNATSYQDSGLTPGTTYYYQLRAFNAGGNSAYSNEASATASSVSAGSWITRTAPTTNQLNAISCPYLNYCYAVGDSGTILTSFDSGVSWTAQNSGTSNNLHGISCPLFNTCYVVGELGTILVTIDSGKSWQDRSVSNTYSLNGIDCPNSISCFAAGGTPQALALVTTNGGNNWTVSFLNTNPSFANQPFKGISCISINNCLSVMSQGMTYRTDNSGISWRDYGGTGIPSYGINCFSFTSACVVGDSGLFWSPTGSSIPASPTTASLRAVSCSGGCYGVGLNGSIVLLSSTAFSNATLTTQNSGVSQNLYGISCPTQDECFAVGAGGLIITNATNGPSKWSPTTFESAQSLPAIGCWDVDHCIAVASPDESGLPGGSVVVTSNGGSIWNMQATGTTARFSDISCPGAGKCFAVGNQGTIMAFNNGSWTSQTSGTTEWLGGISCPSPTTCFTVGNTTIRATTNGGQSWVGLPNTNNLILYSISCPTTTTCFAGGLDSKIIATTDGGANWTTRYTDATAKGYYFPAMNCPTAMVCYAGGSGVMVISKDGGNTWSKKTLPGYYAIYKFSCVGINSCFAVADQGGVFTTVDGGTNWNKQDSGTFHNLMGISCPEIVHCYIVGQEGRILSNATRTETSWNRQPTSVTEPLHAISCPAPGTCFAVGEHSTILATTNWGANWIAQSSSGNIALNGISCPTAINCFTVGNGIKATSNGGANWTTQNPGTTATLNSVSCPTSTSCLAVGVDGTIIQTTNAGNLWTLKTNGYPQTLTSIVCIDVNRCLVVGLGGRILVTTNGGNNWSAQSSPTTQNLWHIDCPSTTICYIAGDNMILTTTNGGTSWNTHASGVSGQLLGLDCWNVTSCSAVGTGGAITATSDGGNSWIAQTSPTTNRLESISCVGSGSGGICFAVGEDGIILSNAIVLKVSAATDNGQGTNPGTLSYMLKNAQAGQTLTLSGIIIVTGSLPPVPPGVTISGSCIDGKPGVTIDGSTAPAGTTGLILSGNTTLSGLKISGFSGSAIKFNGAGNKAVCTIATY